MEVRIGHSFYKQETTDIFDNDCDRDMLEIKDSFTKHLSVWKKTFVIFCWEQRIKEGCLESRDRPSLSGHPLPLLPIQSDKRKNIGRGSSDGFSQIPFNFAIIVNVNCVHCPGPSLTVGH